MLMLHDKDTLEKNREKQLQCSSLSISHDTELLSGLSILDV